MVHLAGLETKEVAIMTGDNGAIQEGKCAAGMGVRRNPYNDAIRRAKTDSEHGRLVELRNCWDSGYYSVNPKQAAPSAKVAAIVDALDKNLYEYRSW